MSDFLISLGNLYNVESLLSIIKKPYGKLSPEGRYFDFPWGSLAVLNERLAENRNIHERNSKVFAWVGDLLLTFSDDTIHDTIEHILYLSNKENDNIPLQNDEFFKKLNGAFAILLAHTKGFSIVTDIQSYTPVYEGRNAEGHIVSYGTHPDLVACISDDSLRLDEFSIAEFLNYGNCIFPNTSYRNVKEIEAKTLHNINCANGEVHRSRYTYWSPPEEITQGYNESELVDELEEALISAVRERCSAEKVVVLLSGGLDSRLVLSAVPRDVECITLTFAEEVNLEVRIARKVAECHNRPWHWLRRDSEFLGNTIVDIVRLIGCEFEWVNAHATGLADRISKYEANYVLTGEPFDVLFKAYYAIDYIKKRRMGGLLSPLYEKKATFDYATDLPEYLESNLGFWERNLRKDVTETVYARRRAFFKEQADPNRSSIEGLLSDPFSHDLDAANWVGDRKVLPIRQVGMDRRLVDISCKCPFELKLGNKLFMKAALRIYGPAARIPDNKDGVRPGSSHLSRLAQRAARKIQDKAHKFQRMMGKGPVVQHSWTDYQIYWQESIVLKELIRKYSANLDQFDGQIFKERGQDLLKHDDIGWRNGFRLLQLAVWKQIVEDYRQFIKKIQR